MRKVLKLISSLVAVVLMLTMVSATASTNYEVMDNAIYIASASVPEDATAYALDMFSHLSAEFVASLGFTYEEACSMRVANGFYAYAYDATVDSTTHYYYPVLVGNEIVALITVSYSDGKYSLNFSADKMASALNEIQTSSSSPIKVVVSYEAFYGIVDNEVYLLSYLPDSDLCVVDEQMEFLSIYSDAYTVNSLSVISSENVYDASVIIGGEQTESRVEELIEVAIVDNVNRTEDSGASHGTCWASCTASLYCYYSGTSSSLAKSIRNTILTERYNSAGTYSGGINVAKSILEEEISGLSLTTKSSSLSWSAIKTAIGTNKAPCYMRWEYNSGETGHATVLCGYYYDSSYPNDSSYYYIEVMDPNKGVYVCIPYGSTYSVGSVEHTWVMTLVKN